MVILTDFVVVEDVFGQPGTHPASLDDTGKVLYICEGSHAGYVLLSQTSRDADGQNSLQTSEFIKNAHKKYGKVKSLSSSRTSKITGPSHYSVVMVGAEFNIERDFVYSLKCKHWPSQALEWKDRIRNFNWPNPVIVDLIVSSGCHLVPVSSHGSLCSDFEWRLSFSWAELQLINTMPEHIKISYAILKTIIKIEMKKHCVDMFVSYHLKTTLFWLLEENGMNEFNEMKISQIVLSLLEHILLFYKSTNMPNYFVRTNNMIDYRSPNEIKNAVQVLEYIKTNLTSIICKYIDEYQTPPISFDGTFTKALQSENAQEIYQLCKYNFVLFAMAKFLLASKEEVFIRLEDDSTKKWCVRYLTKAAALHNLTSDQNPTSQGSEISDFDSEEFDFTTFSKLLETFVTEDKLARKNTCVLFAIFNVFLTILPGVLDAVFIKDKDRMKKVSLYLGNTSHYELFVWLLNFSDEKCSELHDFVTSNWTEKPHFVASDTISKQFARLLTITIAKQTNQSKLVNGTLVKNCMKKDIGILMVPLYQYLLVNKLYSCAFVALQVRAYFSDHNLLWWVNMSMKGMVYKEIKRGTLKMILSEGYFEDQLSLEMKSNYKDMLSELSD